MFHLPRFGNSILFLFALLLVACAPVQTDSTSAQNQSETDWPVYRGDLSGTGYSGLTQIDANNVDQLEVSWRYSLRNDAGENSAEPNSQATPIVTNGMMFLPTVDAIVALNPTNGTEIWKHPVSAGRPSRRGVSYWPGDQGISPRIFFTAGSGLVALDAATGAVDRDFGDSGSVQLDPRYLSVPLVYKNIIVVGANTPPGEPGGIGNPRAYNAISGEQIWEFSSVPQPGQIGHDTWANDSWVDRLGANAWPFYFTVDTETDLLFLPLASPIPFAYGGDRAGDNLFANAIVAVDVNSGEYVWHFQTIHHDLWDHDPPAPPTLFDINQGGESIPALAVTTKSGYLFILNRQTGEPIYDVEEREVPRSAVPGEVASATQPIPSITPPMARVSFSANELATAADTSPAHVTACKNLLDAVGEYENLGPYTPWSVRANDSGPTTLLFPGLAGGPNWGGVAYDPNSQLGYVFATDLGTFGWMEAAEPGADLPYVRSGPRPAAFAAVIDGVSMPCQQPPWSHLTAVDMTTGEIAWRRPLGVTEALGVEKQNTGRPGRASAIITATDLMFIAATDDNRFRALRASTGENLWEVELERRGNANPMTYLGSNQNQYVAISATDELIVYTLPE